MYSSSDTVLKIIRESILAIEAFGWNQKYNYKAQINWINTLTIHFLPKKRGK